MYGLRLDRCTVDLQALDVALLCKNKEEGGSARATPVAAPMPKLVSFLEKRENAQRVLGLRMCVPFTAGVAMYL